MTFLIIFTALVLFFFIFSQASWSLEGVFFWGMVGFVCAGMWFAKLLTYVGVF